MARRHPEDDIQKAVVSHLQARGVPGLVFWHTPNSSKLGGKRTKDGVPLEAIRLKKMGFRAGVSDLVLIHSEKIFALELKAPGGRASSSQLEFIADMNRAGAFTCVCEGLDPALRTLEQWGLLRGAAA